jgi:hypothetical protein
MCKRFRRNDDRCNRCVWLLSVLYRLGAKRERPPSFDADYVAIGRKTNGRPQGAPKYVIVEATGDLARGIPMPAETVIFITNSFLLSEQSVKNIHYILPDQENQIPPGAKVFEIR